MTAKRGYILRDTQTGPGLVSADNKQYSFTLEGMWLSEIPPRPGMAVDVAFTDEGVPVSLQAVPEGQMVREQAQLALAGARTRGSALAGSLRGRFGTSLLVAIAALVVGWFFLGCVFMGGPKVQFTFWQLLGCLENFQTLKRSLDGNATPGSGLYELLALFCVAAPFARFFWKDRRATLGSITPLLLMVLVAFQFRIEIRQCFDSVYFWGASNLGRERAWSNFLTQLALSFGAGAYLSFAASLYLAWTGVRQFLTGTQAPAA